MILAVCADKGAPGVTTLAIALGMVWTGERVVLEADPSGADAPFWARHGSGNSLLATEPSILTLAADARMGLPPEALPRYAQPTTWGVDVIQGAPGAAAFAPMRALWRSVADAAARWSGTVVADLGRLQPGAPAVPVAKAATAVLVLADVRLEGLYHLRERVGELAQTLGDPRLPRPPVAVVAVAGKRDAKTAAGQVSRMLSASGLPIPVAGVFVRDDPAAEQLRAGTLGAPLRDGALLASAATIAETVQAWWPELAPSATADDELVSAAAP